MKIIQAYKFRMLHFLMIFSFTFLLMPINVVAQSNVGETKKARKEREKKEQLDKYEQAKALLLDSAFVIPFDRVLSRYGTMITGIRSRYNFLLVDGENATVQFRSGHAGWSGVNTLGGWTLEGKMINFKVVEKKKKLFITFQITGNIRTKVAISLIGSDYAVVDLDSNYSGRIESLRGFVEPIGKTKIIEGTEF
jgi:hypothetical protein